MVSDEFAFIHRYFANLNPALVKRAKSNGLVLGIGDDAALVQLNGTYAVTTDSLIEQVHFFPNFPAKILGARSLEVNFSDLYAMGALPQYVTLSLEIPERYMDFDEFWSAYSDGLAECLERHNCTLIGGNITHTINRAAPLAISVTAFGKQVDDNKSLRRNAAKVGDLIYVTGSLGANGLYVKSCYNNTLRTLDSDVRRYFEQHAYFYDPHMADFIKVLVNYSSCAIDVSDGLLGDLSHILMQSRCGALLNYESLPLDRISSVLLEELKVSPKSLLKQALSAGGDYNLVFTLDPKRKDKFERELKLNPALADFLVTPIGEVIELNSERFGDNDLATDGGLITIVNNNNEEVTLRLGSGSYNHFIAHS